MFTFNHLGFRAAGKVNIDLFTSQKSTTDGQLLAKIDRDDGPVAPKEVGREVGAAVAKRRNEMVPKLTQKELATKVHSDSTTIARIELGKAPPNQELLRNISRVLGIKLTGTEIGAPLFAPKKK